MQPLFIDPVNFGSTEARKQYAGLAWLNGNDLGTYAWAIF